MGEQLQRTCQECGNVNPIAEQQLPDEQLHWFCERCGTALRIFVRIFVSCSEEDAQLRDELLSFLDETLSDWGVVFSVGGGELELADMAILLLTPEYMNSEALREVQLPHILRRANKEGLVVLPAM